MPLGYELTECRCARRFPFDEAIAIDEFTIRFAIVAVVIAAGDEAFTELAAFDPRLGENGLSLLDALSELPEKRIPPFGPLDGRKSRRFAP